MSPSVDAPAAPRSLNNYVGGSWERPSSDETLVSRNPATGEDLARVPLSVAADVERAVAAARAAQPGWAATPVLARARALMDLRQVLVALFENACKYSLADGQVTVRARARDGLVCVDVQDNGVGIRDVDQPMICTPFFRGESPLKEGRYGGLNLAITQMLIALHGGQLWFESAEGQGSTFSFSLPIVE